MINIKFELSHEDAVIPYKAHDGDLGLDVYPAFDFDYKEIEPGETELIPTGIKTSFSDRYGVITFGFNKLQNKNIEVKNSLISSSDKSEWLIPIKNNSNKPFLISKFPDDFNKENAIIQDYNEPISKIIIISSIEYTPEIVDSIE